jgi:CheY-like chemotaxis protein
MSRGCVQTASRRRVLIADDNRDAALSLGMLLTYAGYDVQTVHNGIAALEAARSFRPPVAILDIGMPGLTGYVVAERIRAEPWGADMLLIALTGWGQPGDRARAFAAGFDHHCTKPVDPDQIERLVASAQFE